MRVLSLVLLWQYQTLSAASEEVSVGSSWRSCPYPLPEMIRPCKCLADHHYKGLLQILQIFSQLSTQ